MSSQSINKSQGITPSNESQPMSVTKFLNELF